jgi:hypothetical protein
MTTGPASANGDVVGRRGFWLDTHSFRELWHKEAELTREPEATQG